MIKTIRQREIKFRVWNKERKEMWSMDNLLDVDGTTPFQDILRNLNGEKDIWKLMQFTGLLDKNGKEIYEGDILDWGDNFPSVVIWSKLAGGETPGFELEEKGDYEYPIYHTLSAYTNPFEVIGNIYENPELLK